MNTDIYKKALFAARVERAGLAQQASDLDAQRAALEERIGKLEETIDGLIVLSGETNDLKPNDLAERVQGLSLAEAAREMLKTSDRFMSPRRVRDMLRQIDYDFSGQTNPLASIHTILKRLVASGEVEFLDVEGKAGYRLRHSDSDGQ
jgi:hypothetical protein